MSDTASNPKEQTRHIIVHRRRTPYRRFKHFITRFTLALTISFIATSIIVDTFHPRKLTPDAVAIFSKNLTPSAHSLITLMNAASIPTRYAAQHTPATVITGNPPTLVNRHLLYWTPVESLTLLRYPASPPIIHHAVPLTLRFYSSSNISVTALHSAQSEVIPRFTPYVVHPREFASLLEHADGFLPARALQTALYSAFVTMHPRILLDALVENSGLLIRYCQTYLPEITIPEPLGWARRISRTARERRAKRANVANTAP